MSLFTRPTLAQPPFLPMTRTEMERLGWDELDVLLVSGDAYVDHPSFAMALLGRTLVAHGLRTGIVTQPRWEGPEDLTAMGRPRLFAGVSAGAIDSMLAHYTAFRKKRSEDAYTPGGMAGARPNRACIVYTNLLRRAFPGLTVVLGGIEASLRRITHYDFWTDALRKPIILDAKADAVVYGMGERALIDIALRLERGSDLTGIPGTVTAPTGAAADAIEAAILFPCHEEIVADPKLLMRATLLMEKQVHDGTDRAAQRAGDRVVVVEPPAQRLATSEMDRLYALPFARTAHPSYDKPIPAEEMIRDSVTSHRGCGGGCSFCTLALHQGRRIASRSSASIEDEVRRMAQRPGFRGQITDVGGPSANMWGAECAKDDKPCKRASCMTPTVCPHFRMDQKAHLDLLRRLRKMPGVKGVRVASGVRFDLALQDMPALQGYLREFVGGQLKIAPEHVCDNVLRLMRKPGIRVFEEFLTVFARESERAGKEQYVIPYLMSAFPGTTDEDMRALGRWLAARGWKPRQVQCFIPIPGAVATAMFVAGITPDGKPVHVARTDEERLRQHRILMPPEEHRPARKGASPVKPHNSPRPASCGAACPRQKPSERNASPQKRAEKSVRRVKR
ncbi:YgiQ family radical SAM protein [Desulfomicrobium escambiense]|uniref:YgiQ family radical SAM protein n=1 Tax=Desulfomicrobium escambiense TaxID=29503 RepID=UPI0003FFD5F2|nr:YgiQ family radical SAM protein [Desulfomicrobium escambiense]